MKFFLTCLAFLLFTLPSYSTHVMGATITYRMLDSFKYYVTFEFYRDCNSVAFGNPSSVSRIRCLSGGTANLNLSLKSIESITPVHDSVPDPCSPSNTYGTGAGVEKHTYFTIIDLNQGAFTALKNCCDLIIETGQCCRNNAITTGITGNFYTYTAINPCYNIINSSPKNSFDPVTRLCCNQPAHLNLGITDKDPADSLAFRWGHPLSGYNQNLTYTGTYIGNNHPFSVYYPGSLTPPTAYPNANPPIGIALYKENGEIVFTPTDCNQITVAVLEVEEWRKINDTMRQIGLTRFDLEFRIVSCAGNNPPVIDAQLNHHVCLGDSICFNITTDDAIYVPPPPNPVPLPDSTYISWDSGIQGASFTVTNKGALHETARVCWTPDSIDYLKGTHFYTVEVRDNNGPLNSITRVGGKITVFEKVSASILVDTLSCGWFSIDALSDNQLSNILWLFRDSVFTVIPGADTAFMKSSNSTFSNQIRDSLAVIVPGGYVLRLDPEVNQAYCKNLPDFELNVSPSMVHHPMDAPTIQRIEQHVFTTDSSIVDWYKDGVFAGTGFELKNIGPGVYKAQRCDDSCCSEFSNEVFRTVGFEQLESYTYSVYPNPSSGQYILESSFVANWDEIELTVYSSTGQEVMSSVNQDQGKLLISIPDSPGVYYLKIQHEGTTRVLKLIKL